MSQTLKWKFEENQAGAIEGPAHPGMAHFTGDRETSIIREAIQNSLDAEAPDSAGPVTVNFQHKMLDADVLAVDSLARHIQYAIDSPHNEEKYRPIFERAQLLMGGGGGTIASLCITDSNTIGAIDINHNDRPTFWDTLIKGEGLTNKPQKNAAGSFGIGKFASFVATPLRTVLYCTAFLGNKHLEHRFMGKTILVSHKGKSGILYKRVGYLGDGFESIKNEKVPGSLKLNEPGTSIYIPGYSFANDDFDQWEKEGVDIVLSNYFHAIIHHGLEVNVGDSKININTYKSYLKDVKNKKFQDYIRVSLDTPVDHRVVPDVGDISIRIEVDKDNRNKEIALVRDAGMLITTDRKHMFPKLARLPGHWWGFTAIIECKSKGEALLKQAESPRHDQISIDNISDEELRKRAKGLFDDIGNWCYQVIKEFVESDPGTDSENVTELAEYLPIEGDEPQDAGQDNPDSQGDPIVTTPVQSLRAPWKPKKNKTKKRDEKPTETVGNGEKPSSYRMGEKEGKKGKERNFNIKPQSFVGVRFRKGSSDAHSVIVTFEQPETTPTKIEMLSVGEDGTKYPMGIRKAIVGDKPLQVVDDNLFSLPDIKPGERQEIEIFTREPVTDKTFSIRFFEE